MAGPREGRMVTSPPPAADPLSAGRWRLLLPLGVPVLILVLPVPTGLTPTAWRYFALFAAVVAGLVVEPVPAPAVGFIGMAAAAASRLAVPDAEGSVRWAIS